MPDPRLAAVARRATRLADPDTVLVERYAADADPAAFAELLARHGPGVWAVCRRHARTEADAEDVFQATFLVLARDAGRVRAAASVGSWLFGVAVRLGRKHRARAARTPDPARLTRSTPPDPAAVVGWDEVRAALDEELAALPDALRAPLLLCYYHGLTQDEAAAELGWAARTVKAKVARGRAVLRARLTRRGVELPAALAVPLLAAANPVPARVLDALAAGPVHPAGVSPAAVALARPAARVPVHFAVGFAVVLAAGAAFAVQDRPAALQPAAQPPAVAPAAPDDPLPRGAIHRIGTTLFRLPFSQPKAFFTRDPDRILVTGWEEPGRVIDVRTGKVVHRLAPPRGRAADADATPAGDRLAVVGTHWKDRAETKGQPAVWLIDTTTRTVLRRIDLIAAPANRKHRVRLSADGAVVVVAGGTEVSVWDAKTGDGLDLYSGGAESADAVAVSADGRTVAFGRYELFVWRWDTEPRPKRLVRIGGVGTDDIAFTPDGKRLVVNVWRDAKEGRPPAVFTYDLATGAEVAEWPVAGSIGGLAFAPDGKALSFHSTGEPPARPDGHAIRLLDPATGRDLRTILVGRVPLRHFSWSADGSRVVGATNYLVRVWDARTGRPVGPEVGGHEAHVRGQTFTPDGTLFTGSDDQTVRGWDAAGRQRFVVPTAAAVYGFAVSPDGAVVAGLDMTGTVRLWDAKTGAERRTFGGGVEDVGGTRLVRFTADGARLVTWADDLVLRVWDAGTGKQLAAHPTQPPRAKGAGPVTHAERVKVLAHLGPSGAISPDGSAFAHATADGVRVLDPATGAVRRTFGLTTEPGVQLAWSPDAKRLVAATPVGRDDADGTDDAIRYDLTAWDVAAGQKVWTAASTVPPTTRLAFTPDGSRLAQTTAAKWNAGYALRFFDAATGADAGRIDLPGPPETFAFDTAGRKVSVAFDDTTALVFDVAVALVRPNPKMP